jgi:hypothetical protein
MIVKDNSSTVIIQVYFFCIMLFIKIESQKNWFFQNFCFNKNIITATCFPDVGWDQKAYVTDEKASTIFHTIEILYGKLKRLLLPKSHCHFVQSTLMNQISHKPVHYFWWVVLKISTPNLSERQSRIFYLSYLYHEHGSVGIW